MAVSLQTTTGRLVATSVMLLYNLNFSVSKCTVGIEGNLREILFFLFIVVHV